MLEKEMLNQFSDVDVLLKHSALAASHDHEDKEKLWNEYVKGDNLTVKQLRASAAHFYNLEDEG